MDDSLALLSIVDGLWSTVTTIEHRLNQQALLAAALLLHTTGKLRAASC